MGIFVTQGHSANEYDHSFPEGLFGLKFALQTLPNDDERRSVFQAIGNPDNNLRFLAYGLVAAWAQQLLELVQKQDPELWSRDRDSVMKSDKYKKMTEFWNQYQDLLKVVTEKDAALAIAEKYLSCENQTLAYYARENIRVCSWQ